MPIFYGEIVFTRKHKNKIYIICNDNEIYSLIEHDLINNVTDVIKRVSDLSYIEFLLNKKICNDSRND